MDKSLFIAMTGAKHNMLAQAAHANNLANVSTTGFKAELSAARSMPVYYGAGLPTRAYALAEAPAPDLSQGSLQETGRPLDVAIRGEGFIAVGMPDGSEAYTRVGSLQQDAFGVLRSEQGLPVLGNGGPIALPPAESITIGSDGSITVVGLGEGANAPALIDRIRLVNPDPAELSRSADGLFVRLDADDVLPADGRVQVTSGYLEDSNVNAVSELTSILSLSRQYELQVKLIQKSEQMSEASAQLLQSNT